ncbi:MAG: gephyrin-like molybdotransferase Glp [Glaciecola sp.]
MSCACDSPGLMPIEKAKQVIWQTIAPIDEIQQCDLKDSLDRVLAIDIVSPINVPAYDNSAMDGYALRYQDLAHSNTLHQVGKSFAGKPFDGELDAGECVRIMTGAEIPIGADTVVMQENTSADNLKITFIEEVSKGSAIRPAGGDISKDSVVLKAGKQISAIDIGLLASLGIASVSVYRQLKVAVFSTGDELLMPGQPSQPGRIFDSNRPMLVAMLQRIGAQVIDMGVIGDDPNLIRQAFDLADQQADCVVTSGGVSVGEADYTRDILQEIGQVDFWKLAIKPGKPLAFGRLPNSIFFGLPGNPVSAAVTFDQIAGLALKRLAGSEVQPELLVPALATKVFKKKPGRTDYQRAYCFKDEDGTLCVETNRTQSSGVLSGFASSNCYAVLENKRGRVEVGETVSVLFFDRVLL